MDILSNISIFTEQVSHSVLGNAVVAGELFYKLVINVQPELKLLYMALNIQTESTPETTWSLSLVKVLMFDKH